MYTGFRRHRARNNARRLCAVAFLLFLLVEIGSHATLDTHFHADASASMAEDHHDEHHHDDLCDAVESCADEDRNDQQLPNLQDENTHHHVLAASSYFRFVRESRVTERTSFVATQIRTSDISPPYLPPKYS